MQSFTFIGIIGTKLDFETLLKNELIESILSIRITQYRIKGLHPWDFLGPLVSYVIGLLDVRLVWDMTASYWMSLHVLN